MLNTISLFLLVHQKKDWYYITAVMTDNSLRLMKYSSFKKKGNKIGTIRRKQVLYQNNFSTILLLTCDNNFV